MWTNTSGMFVDRIQLVQAHSAHVNVHIHIHHTSHAAASLLRCCRLPLICQLHTCVVLKSLC
jgi:hypothetical protein